MTLANLIRQRDTGNIATAIPATSATEAGQEGETVAGIASVAVASSKETSAAKHVKVGARDTANVSMTADQERAICAWLELIGETDAATMADVLDQCRRDADARDYFTGQAAAELPKPDFFPDDRRTCNQCANLIARRCQSAKRGEIVASRNYEPIRELPRRCEGYEPRPNDPDRGHGRERWPGLIQKGGE